MSFTSFAQNREDVLLDRAFARGIKGFYIDVGAHDPVVHSVTKHFYDQGWHGINIEPVPEVFGRLAADRDRDVNLNVGISDEEGSLTLFESPPGTGLSSFSPEIARHHREAGWKLVERTVPVTTLAAVCEEHVGTTTIDFLSVDVEGFERHVLEGADFERFRPRIVLVEATKPGSAVPAHEDWEKILLAAGYTFATFDGLNRYYVREEDLHLREVFEVPVNIFDNYVVHEHVRQLEDLRLAATSYERYLAAARAKNEALQAQLGSVPDQLGRLRAEYEKMDRALTNIRAECEALRHGALQAAEDHAAELQRTVIAVREDLDSTRRLLGGLGPTGIAVARRLSRVSSGFPAAASIAKRGLRVLGRRPAP